MKFNAKFLLCLISAIMTALPFLVPSFGFLAYFSLIPFLYMLFYKCTSTKEAAGYGFLFGTMWYLLVLTWIFYLYPLQNVCKSPALCVVLLTFVWILISMVMGGEVALFSYAFKRWFSYGKLKALSAAAVWVLMEYIQQFGDFGFTWCRISLTQYMYTPIIQSASLFGGLFVSFVIVLINALLTVAVKNKKMFYVFLGILCFVSNIILGAIAPDFKPYKEISVSLVWEDVNPDDKRAENSTKGTFEKLMAESRKQESEIVIWSETAVPVIMSENSKYFRHYQKLCREKDFMLFAGGFLREGENLHSSVLCIDESGERIGKIHKRKLVPFGEYVPLRNLIKLFVPSIEEISPREEEIVPFDKECVIETKFGKTGGIICYDSCFPHIARECAREGAEIITLSTNDAWFYGSHAAKNHLSQSIFRAVENGRYVLRCANLGESVIIDNEGRIIKGEESGKLSLSGSGGLIKEKTLYTKIGDSFIILLIVLIICVKKGYDKKVLS